MSTTVAQMPEMFLYLTALLAGCCIGSFLNVVIHRLPAKESLVSPGSHCPHCGTPIELYDNIPILSFLLLGGKCRRCRARISFRYPVVEGLCGALALALMRKYGVHPQFFIEALFVFLLVAIAFIDLDTFLIPDVLSLPGIVAGFATSFFTPRLSWSGSLTGILVGGGVLYLVAIGYQRLRHQEGLGGGDIKLLGMIGAFVGIMGVIFTVLVASVVGTLVGLAVMRRSNKGLTTMLPFGPFLSLGAVSYLFWGQSFFHWYLSSFAGS
jgi:leader peptidase (prepilin peptidase)/N-methyltransferase